MGVPGMATEGTFYTDSNGRDTMTRVRDQRPSFNYSVLEPIAGKLTCIVCYLNHLTTFHVTTGNFYPVNVAYIRGPTGLSLAVVTDRAEGGSSIIDGELQIVVQRRLLYVSRFGLRLQACQCVCEGAFSFTGRSPGCWGASQRNRSYGRRPGRTSQSPHLASPWWKFGGATPRGACRAVFQACSYIHRSTHWRVSCPVVGGWLPRLVFWSVCSTAAAAASSHSSRPIYRYLVVAPCTPVREMMRAMVWA